jgi:peptidyl-prolyl cis-trans isomerase A (cyclophilin A)
MITVLMASLFAMGNSFPSLPITALESAGPTLAITGQPPDSLVLVRIETDFGAIVAELEPARAPRTVANFLRYVDEEAYAGGAFHRTVRSDNQPDDSVRIAVIQGGASPNSERHPPIEMESTEETGIHHLDGVLSMARGGPHSATHGFFICVGDQPELDHGGARNPDGYGFAAFGRVIEGMEVVRRIHAGEASGQILIEPVVIRSIRRVEGAPDGGGSPG